MRGSRLRSPAPGFPPSRERRLCKGPACGAPPLGSRLRGNDGYARVPPAEPPPLDSGLRRNDGCARGPACGAPPLDSGLRRNDGCARVPQPRGAPPPEEPRPWVPAFAGTTVVRGWIPAFAGMTVVQGSRLRSPAPGFPPSRERRLCEGPACGAPPLGSRLRGNDGYARVLPAEPRPWVPAFAGTTVVQGSRLRSPAPGFRPSRERRLCEGPACGAPPLGSGLRGNDGYARVPPAEPRPWVPAFAGTTVMRGSRLRSPAPGFRPSRERRLCKGSACGAPPLDSGLRRNDGCARVCLRGNDGGGGFGLDSIGCLVEWRPVRLRGLEGVSGAEQED